MKVVVIASSFLLLLSGTTTFAFKIPHPVTHSSPSTVLRTTTITTTTSANANDSLILHAPKYRNNYLYHNNNNNNQQHYHHRRTSPLFMGRAAAVRAATKGKTDAKKAKVNGYYGKKIIMAVKQGGSSDPVANRQLGELIKAAKNNSVPMDNITRAIKRATEKDSGDFSESTFEAYGHGGASLIVNVLSDNPNRSTADVKSAISKNQGKMAESGSVLFMYDLKGKIVIPAVNVDEEALLMAAIENNVNDMELVEGEEEGTSVVYTDPKETAAMFEAVKAMGLDAGAKMSLSYVSKAPVECSDADFEKNMAIIDALEELDDVDSVEHNMSN